MSELRSVGEMLGQWPLAQLGFIMILAALGIATYMRGERDRRTLGPSAIEIPAYLISGPLADAMRSMHNVSEQSRETNRLLGELINEVRTQNRLIEWAGNQAGMSSPPRGPRGR